MAGGTFLVIYSGSSKKESIDATEALRPRVGGDILGDDSGGKGSAVGAAGDIIIKSPLLPRHSPAMSNKSPRLRKLSSDYSGANGTAPTTKVIWEID